MRESSLLLKRYSLLKIFFQLWHALYDGDYKV